MAFTARPQPGSSTSTVPWRAKHWLAMVPARIGQPHRLPYGCPILAGRLGRRERLLREVEDRPVGVNARHRSLNAVVGLEPLRRGDALEDPGRRARSVAADGEDALATVEEFDPQHRGAVGSLVHVADVVDAPGEAGPS
jgi:hypothetical protein